MQRFMHGVARWMAVTGGVILLVLTTLTCLSVLGRIANSAGHSNFVESHVAWAGPLLTRLGPINGDFEIVEAGIAFAIFAFFPWCMINRGHAQVDVFTAMLPRAVNRFLGLIWDIIFALVLAVISWRLFIGMSDKMRYQETTFLLEFPVWWGFAFSSAASLIAALVAVYMVVVRVQEIRNPEPEDARHKPGSKKRAPENHKMGSAIH